MRILEVVMIGKLSRVLLVVLLMLSIGVSGCQLFKDDKQAIKETITEFFFDYNNREYSKLLELFSSGKRKIDGDNVIIDEFKERFWGERMKVREIEEPLIFGSSATVNVHAVGQTFGGGPYQIKLVKEGWNWKISDFSR